MKLRFHYEATTIDPVPTISGGCNCEACMAARRKIEAQKKTPTQSTRGLIVLESQPQLRTIFTAGNKGTQRFAFPYLLNVICYKVSEGKYIYPGIYGGGLRVFFRNSPMQNFTDEVFLPPIDANRYGLVCTPHDYDNKQFSSLPELVSKVITLWWNTYHVVEYKSDPQWKDMTIEQALSCSWKDGRKLYDALVQTEKSGYGAGGFYPPKDSELVNENWPPKPKSSIVAGLEALQKELQRNEIWKNAR